MHVSMSGVVCSAFCQLTETRAEGTARCRQAAMGRPQLGCLAKALAQARAKRKKGEGKGTKEGNNRTVKGQKKEEKNQRKVLAYRPFSSNGKAFKENKKGFPRAEKAFSWPTVGLFERPFNKASQSRPEKRTTPPFYGSLICL